MLLRRTICSAILFACVLLLMLFPFSTASAPQQQQGIAPQPPGSVDSAEYDPSNPDPRPGFDTPGELNPEQKRQAFLDVTNGNGIVGDFDFRVGDNLGTIGNFIPLIVLQSMAEGAAEFDDHICGRIRTRRAGQMM